MKPKSKNHYIVRVGVMNNFNMTLKEIVDLHRIKFPKLNKKEPLIFVNSNSYVEIDKIFPSVITINPHFYFVKPRGKIDNIKAVRIKYILDAKPLFKIEFQKCVDWCLEQNIPILLTYMRFIKKETLLTYTDSQDNYYRKGCYYYPKISIRPLTDKNVFVCDEKGLGCQSCLNCSKLTYGIKTKEIYSLNLSSSGVCNFNCPDCFAQNQLKRFNHLHPRYDVVYKNKKQLK